MFLFNQSQPQYARVNDYEGDNVPQVDEDDPKPHRRIRYKLSLFLLVLTVAVGLVAGSTVGILFSNGTLMWDSIAADGKGNGRCIDPEVRQEWRALDETQKKEYIKAFQCLTSTPSRLVKYDGTLYDDLTLVHVKYGGFCMSMLCPIRILISFDH